MKVANELVEELTRLLVKNGEILDERTVLELAIFVVEREKAAITSLMPTSPKKDIEG